MPGDARRRRRAGAPRPRCPRRLAAQVDDDRDGPPRPRRARSARGPLDARVLEPDAHSRPAGDVGRPRRRACPARGLSVVPRVTSPPSRARSTSVRDLDAVPERPRRGEHRVLEHEPAPQVDRERDRPPAERRRCSASDDAIQALGRPDAGRDRRAGDADRRPDRAHRRRALRSRTPGTTFRRAFTRRPPRRARRRRRRGPRGTRAAGPRRRPRPRTRGTSRPRSRSTGRAPTWRNALRRASGEPAASGRPPPRLRPSVATPEPAPPPDRQRRERAQQRRRAGRERLVGPRLVLEDEIQRRTRGDPATRPRSRRRTPPRRAAGSTGRPATPRPRRTAATTDRPSRIASSTSSRRAASAAPSAISSRCRDRESTSNGRPSGPTRSTRVARPAARRPSRGTVARPAPGSSACRSPGPPWRSAAGVGAAARPARPCAGGRTGPRARPRRPTARATRGATCRAGSPALDELRRR